MLPIVGRPLFHKQFDFDVKRKTYKHEFLDCDEGVGGKNIIKRKITIVLYTSSNEVVRIFIAMRGIAVVLLASLSLAMGQGPVRVRFLHIISEIQSRFAITDVTSVVENTANFAQEVVFSAQLPEAAFISNFSMEIDFQIVVGEVRATEAARRKYEEDVRQGKSAGLVSQVPRETNTFEIAVNVAAGKTVTFVLTYQELLRRVQGAYKQIVNVQPRGPVDDIRVDVLIAEQGEINLLHVPQFAPRIAEKSNKELLALPEDQNVVVRSHIEKTGSLAYISYTSGASDRNNPSDGQLVVLYDVDRQLDGGQIEVVNGYFIHFFAPEGLNPGNKHVVFVLDKSGSMQGKKFQQTKDAMKRILRDLRPDDRFNVLMFSNDVQPWTANSLPATRRNVEEAINFVDNAQAGGGTNIYDAVFLGMDMIDRDSTRTFASMVILLTDGQPTVGRTDPQQIARDIANRNRRANYMINGLAFGEDADFDMMEKIATQNGGLARKIYEDSDADLQLSGFYDQISAPLLRQLQIVYLNESVDVNSLVQDEQLDYFQGSERVTAGKVKPNKQNSPIKASVSARNSNGKTINLQADAMPLTTNELGTKCIPVPRTGEWASMPQLVHFPASACPRIPQRDDPPSPFRPPRQLLAADTVGGFVERMWAYLTIKKILRQAKYEASSQFERNRLRDEALKMSIKYNFVTELTSMVVSSDFVDFDRNSGQPFGDIKRGGLQSSGNKPSPSSPPRGTKESISGGSGRPGPTSRIISGGGSGSRGPSGVKPPPPPPSVGLPALPFPTNPSAISPKPSPNSGPCKVDVIFIVDESASYSQFLFAKNMISSISNELRFSNNPVRFAVVKLSKENVPSVILKLNDRKNLLSINRAMSAIKRSRGSSFNPLLKEMSSGGSKRVVMYFTGKDDVGANLERQITSLRRQGVVTYSILMGARGQNSNALAIANSPSNILKNPQTKDLSDILKC